MSLSFLEVFNFRNLSHIAIEPSADFNVFYGENGSGKTSILEAIYHLSLGRSFRTRFFNHIIQYGQDKFTIFSKISDIPTGIERENNGKLRIKITDQEIKFIAELAENLPIQLINPDSYQLLTEGPKIRREFIDFGLFHVEQSFLSLWKQAERILKQRNAALKSRESANIKQIPLWDENFIVISEKINELREKYIEKFETLFFEIVSRLLEIGKLKLVFYPGWKAGSALSEVLKNSLNRDLTLGYTQNGPHRADLLIYVEDKLAQEVCSRGQLKLLVYAMKIAQAMLLERAKEKKSVFLIDDLPSELDRTHRNLLCELLAGLKTQIFVTGIEKEAFDGLFETKKTKMFHVEHGKIKMPEKDKVIV